MCRAILFFILLFSPLTFFGQSYEVEEFVVELTGSSTNVDFSNNTYYHAYDSCDVSWQIIRDSIPLGWQYSLCFPNCYEPGITSGNSLFLSNTEQYLNCHIYPNNIAGSGIIEMEITTNNIHKDTVVWNATATDQLFINELAPSTSKSIVNIYNLEGRLLSKLPPNQIVLVEYDNGLFEKRMLLRK